MGKTSEVDELRQISKVAARAVVALGKPLPSGMDHQTICLDLGKVHDSGCPLDLAGLLVCRESDLLHDVMGIHRHLDRDTGELLECFWPRYANKRLTP